MKKQLHRRSRMKKGKREVEIGKNGKTPLLYLV
jgi:hypothetical protein